MLMLAWLISAGELGVEKLEAQLPLIFQRADINRTPSYFLMKPTYF